MRGHLFLTPRDKALLSLLLSYGILKTSFIRDRIFHGVATTTLLRRLRKLEAHEFIARVGGLPFGAFAWRVTEKGAAVVSEKSPKRYFPKAYLDHDLAISEIRFALEGAGIAQSWMPEHEIRSLMARQHGVKSLNERTIPDGIIVANHRERKESLAIEVELHFKNRDRYLRTFQHYKEKKKLFAVWYFVSSVGLGKHLARLWKEQEASSLHFLWSLKDEVLKSPIEAQVFNNGFSCKVKDFFCLKL